MCARTDGIGCPPDSCDIEDGIYKPELAQTKIMCVCGRAKYLREFRTGFHLPNEWENSSASAATCCCSR